MIYRENWSATGVDTEGDAYGELLQKGTEDIGSGAGQYIAPWALISAMVDCLQPKPTDTVVDPACGTGGFLWAAHDYANRGAEHLDPATKDHLRHAFISGTELVDGTARLAAMNLLPHGIGKPDGDSLISVGDALTSDVGRRWSAVLAKPTLRTQVLRHHDRRGPQGEPRRPRDRQRRLLDHDGQQVVQLRPAHQDDHGDQGPGRGRPS